MVAPAANAAPLPSGAAFQPVKLKPGREKGLAATVTGAPCAAVTDGGGTPAVAPLPSYLTVKFTPVDSVGMPGGAPQLSSLNAMP